ncbi:UDP-N-acetylglucosamine 4-epimerase [Pustulibacterium marinum]|uniref:UDP-N-acetylglucosamine 4-epimerase n=1 Tax=Pustulibacterium marinum TaxID=1224947 RepID=A0A1I7ETN5_9FLAO|nr:SDR family oxidoreductase [Pustulibacterium marinum]SFU27280.1 UDP-N-acetylglucosamine 4-epimerase [Pustulibacterium marinum]
MPSRIIENTTVLVTGGAGFIGSNLVDVLLTQNNKVICLDNLVTGHKKNIEKHFNNPDFTFIEGDIRDLATCLQATKDVEIVLHQAALGSVPRSINDPITSNEVNISGFLNMLWAVKENGVKRFVYAASSSTYGDHPDLPKMEDIIGNPLSPYAVTKYVNELYAKVFATTYGIETIGLRYFNVFGPKQDPNGAYAAVIPKFINLMKSGEAPIINGNGEHSRDFTYIDNVVQMNQLAALTDNKEAVNTVYNVACGDNTNLNELFEEIKINLKANGFEVPKTPVYGPERKGDVKHSLASIEKAKSLLHYAPTVTFEAGLKNTVEWFLDTF